MSEIRKELKRCATCQYWDGERMITGNKHVKIQNDLIKGNCAKKRRAMQGNQIGCTDFAKWDRLP